MLCRLYLAEAEGVDAVRVVSWRNDNLREQRLSPLSEHSERGQEPAVAKHALLYLFCGSNTNTIV